MSAIDGDDDILHRKTVAVCRECSGLVNPFYGAEEALRWAQQHRDGTGHEVRLVDGWPSPDEAVAKAFPEGGSDA